MKRAFQHPFHENQLMGVSMFFSGKFYRRISHEDDPERFGSEFSISSTGKIHVPLGLTKVLDSSEQKPSRPKGAENKRW